MSTGITVEQLTGAFQDKIEELLPEPEFHWSREKVNHAVDGGGKPAVKLAIANVDLDYDLWAGLRNPAMIGLYPVGLPEIWEFCANRKRGKLDESGRKTIFQISRSFDFARQTYGRAVIIAVMLPVSAHVAGEYTQSIFPGGKASSHLFNRMYQSLNLILDRITARVAMDLITKDNVVVPMNADNVRAVSTETQPITRQGDGHGPAKGGNYPQKSIAVLTGLGQFGVSRIVLRDELREGTAERFAGPIRSIILFDRNDPVRDGSGGVIYPSPAWRDFLFQLSDFTHTDPDADPYRFCTYLPGMVRRALDASAVALLGRRRPLPQPLAGNTQRA